MVELEQLNIHSSRDIIARHGLTLPELFALSLEFYKEEKHQFNLSYDQKNQLAAYWRQSALGPYHPDKLNPGYFDFVGNDRKKAWEALGEISANGAMAGFCNLLETVCPDLVPWIRHKKRERENKILEKKKEEEAKKKKQLEEEMEASKLINIVRKAEEKMNQDSKQESSDEDDDEMPGLEKNDRTVHTAPPPATSTATPTPSTAPPTPSAAPSSAAPPTPTPTTNTEPSPSSSQNGVSGLVGVVETTKCPELLLPQSTNGIHEVQGIQGIHEDPIEETVNGVTVTVDDNESSGNKGEEDVDNTQVNGDVEKVEEPVTETDAVELNSQTAQVEPAVSTADPKTEEAVVPVSDEKEGDVNVQTEPSLPESAPVHASIPESAVVKSTDTASPADSKIEVCAEVSPAVPTEALTDLPNDAVPEPEVTAEINSDPVTEEQLEAPLEKSAEVILSDELKTDVEESQSCIEDKVIGEMVSEVVAEAEKEIAEEIESEVAKAVADEEKRTNSVVEVAPADSAEVAVAEATSEMPNENEAAVDVPDSAELAGGIVSVTTQAVTAANGPTVEEVTNETNEPAVEPAVEPAAETPVTEDKSAAETEVASSSQTAEASQSNADATPEALNAILTQHFACVLYLKQMKEAGHTLTAEQENYLVQMSAYDDQLNALKTRLVQASGTETSQESATVSDEKLQENTKEESALEVSTPVESGTEETATENEVTPTGKSPEVTPSVESPEETLAPTSDSELDKDTLLVPSRSVSNSQESFSVISSGEFQVMSSDEMTRDSEDVETVETVAQDSKVIVPAEPTVAGIESVMEMVSEVAAVAGTETEALAEASELNEAPAPESTEAPVSEPTDEPAEVPPAGPAAETTDISASEPVIESAANTEIIAPPLPSAEDTASDVPLVDTATEIQTKGPTEATEAATEAPAEAAIEASTEEKTEVLLEAPTQVITEEATEVVPQSTPNLTLPEQSPVIDTGRDLATPDNAEQLSALASTLQNQLPDPHTDSTSTAVPAIETDEDSDGDVRMWSKTGVDLFIAEVSRDADSVLSVGRGETVTVRIPTYESGTALYWEFATENYDIGFGASFEWEEEVVSSPDKTAELKVRREPILPILRRSSHEKVITGSHAFPRCGTYLLMFDNSFSLLRSKTVYYRVFYTR